MESMGERLKRLRIENNLTQENVGKAIGVQKAAVNKYEKGNVENIKRTTIMKLAKLYNVKPSYILCLEEEKKENEEIKLSEHEIKLIKEYRNHPEMQAGIDKMLDIKPGKTIAEDLDETIPQINRAFNLSGIWNSILHYRQATE